MGVRGEQAAWLCVYSSVMLAQDGNQAGTCHGQETMGRSLGLGCPRSKASNLQTLKLKTCG